MSILSSLRASASALTAQRLRLDLIANNIANMDTTRTPAGGPYRRQRPVFEPGAGAMPFRALLPGGGPQSAGQGVRVVAIEPDPRPPRLVYDPGHPDANAEGMVAYPDINLVTEMVDMIGASRAYEASVTVFNAAKTMAMRAIDILKA